MANEGELEPHGRPRQVGEPGTGGPHAALDVDHAQRFTEFDVVLRLEVEGRKLTPSPELDVVLFRLPVRNILFGNIGEPGRERLELVFHPRELRPERFQLRRDAADLIDQILADAVIDLSLRQTDLSGDPVLFGAELFHLGDETPPLLVQGEHATQILGRPSPSQRRAERVRVRTDRLQIEQSGLLESGGRSTNSRRHCASAVCRSRRSPLLRASWMACRSSSERLCALVPFRTRFA